MKIHRFAVFYEDLSHFHKRYCWWWQCGFADDVRSKWHNRAASMWLIEEPHFTYNLSSTAGSSNDGKRFFNERVFHWLNLIANGNFTLNRWIHTDLIQLTDAAISRSMHLVKRIMIIGFSSHQKYQFQTSFKFPKPQPKWPEPITGLDAPVKGRFVGFSCGACGLPFITSLFRRWKKGHWPAAPSTFISWTLEWNEKWNFIGIESKYSMIIISNRLLLFSEYNANLKIFKSLWKQCYCYGHPKFTPAEKVPSRNFLAANQGAKSAISRRIRRSKVVDYLFTIKASLTRKTAEMTEGSAFWSENWHE